MLTILTVRLNNKLHIYYFSECPIRTPSSGVDRGGLGHGHGSRSPVCFVLEEVQKPFVHGTVP